MIATDAAGWPRRRLVGTLALVGGPPTAAPGLSAPSARARHRIRVKSQVIADLIAQCLTFPQAAARSRELGADLREDWKATERDVDYGGCTEDERLRRSVVTWVGAALREQPDGGAAVPARLEAEAAAVTPAPRR